jgi:hypothetical protein
MSIVEAEPGAVVLFDAEDVDWIRHEGTTNGDNASHQPYDAHHRRPRGPQCDANPELAQAPCRQLSAGLLNR